jgi:peptide/nickel transport system substrate-binding protein
VRRNRRTSRKEKESNVKPTSRDPRTFARSISDRLNRRRLLQGSAGLVSTLTLGRSVTPRPAVAAQETPQGGTLVSMVVAEPTSMDIASGTGQHNYSVMCNVFENLLEYDATSFATKPALAESYDVSEDGMAYTFHLRDGVKFHDGTTMDAAAVQFSYQRIMDPDNEFYKLGQPFPLIDFWYEAIDP